MIETVDMWTIRDVGGLKSRRTRTSGVPRTVPGMIYCTALAIVIFANACSHEGVSPSPVWGPDVDITLMAPPETSIARSDAGMVVTGSPEATRVGTQILEAGGNAVDAAVAAAFTLGVSDVDASGLGGMTYMLIRFADGRVTAIDGTPRAPLVVDRSVLIEMQKAVDWVGYPMIAVPTSLAVLDTANTKYGTMPMADLLRPAIEIAESGFRLSPIQINWTRDYYDYVTATAYLSHIAMEDGRTVDPPGTVYCRPDLARTLRRIAKEGTDSFYRGSIAADIATDMIANGGFVRKTDLAVTKIREVAPYKSTYRDTEIYTFPSPGGGPAVARTLDILETYPSDFLARHSIERMQVMIEAARLGRAGPLESDIHHPGHITSPEQSKEFTRHRAQLITPGRALPKELLETEVPPECRKKSGDSTTHVSVADQWGNVVSMTQSIGGSYGAMVAGPGLGFPYNNLLQVFSFDNPRCPGFLLPRSEIATDMAPTIVVEDGAVIAALGAPGSSRIPSYIATIVSNLVDAQMDLADAMSTPRVLWGGTRRQRPFVEIKHPITDADADEVQAMGYDEVARYHYPPRSREIVNFGGINALAWDPKDRSWVGVADGHRWGSALGPRVVVARD